MRHGRRMRTYITTERYRKNIFQKTNLRPPHPDEAGSELTPTRSNICLPIFNLNGPQQTRCRCLFGKVYEHNPGKRHDVQS